MGERLVLRQRGPYQPDQVTKDQIEDINQMMQQFDAVQRQVLNNCIQQYVAIHGEISPETADLARQFSEAIKPVLADLFKTEFMVTGLSRLQGIIRNPNIAPSHVLKALEMGFRVNAMMPKAPLVQIQNNSNHFEGMLAEAEKLRAIDKPNGNNGNSGNNSGTP